MKKLNLAFFRRPTLQVTQDLLGKILKVGDCSGRINEVEAYIGQNDPACHAAVGMTERNRVMFGPAGHLYVYFTYGMYHCVNIVTETEGFPAAVLIRSIEPLEGKGLMEKRRGRKENLCNGPGKLCIALGLSKDSHNGSEADVYDDGFRPEKIHASPRIGIKVGLDRNWRFYY
ncbi:DNA-3-methyladenine glycosylase [Patescibacteria group bacterium]|nr:DNA-3-methyladenine glycosylase [Patescibacteria group bacterium]MBU1015634.1 DNA-3-methyladenine glycosylase [Patescibacteria group bacterium]MBU1684989.1 DNA-3-methyladenine glycosylase [Patescibacteria group bacterium]MBU1938531.1 DNA-3-methyladenine glycosylase [Patescibacteria group bacterium]